MFLIKAIPVSKVIVFVGLFLYFIWKVVISLHKLQIEEVASHSLTILLDWHLIETIKLNSYKYLSEYDFSPDAKMIGTSISMRTTPVLTYPSISVCSCDDPAVLVGEKLYESRDSYRAFKDKNITIPYKSGGIPNLADMLFYILTKDANGTRHLLHPGGLRAWKRLNPDSIVTKMESTR